MNVLTSSRISILLALLPVVALGQQAPHVNTTLSVNGQSGEAPVIQRAGRSYVDVEALARITKGTLAFQGGRIILTLPETVPNAGADAPKAPAAASATRPKPAFSKEFVPAAIEELIAVRDWRAAIVETVRKGAPLSEETIAGFRRSADNKQTLAAAAASTDADHKILPLLQEEFNNMQSLSDRFLQMKASVSYIRPDSLDNDPQDKQVVACASGITSMANSGQFADVPTCHGQ